MATDREMIEVIATKVMGWEDAGIPINGWMKDRTLGSLILRIEFNPFESWADAGMVLEALAAKGAEPCLWWDRSENRWEALIRKPRPFEANDSTNALYAIGRIAYEFAKAEATA